MIVNALKRDARRTVKAVVSKKHAIDKWHFS